jgi:hypothetical protein
MDEVPMGEKVVGSGPTRTTPPPGMTYVPTGSVPGEILYWDGFNYTLLAPPEVDEAILKYSLLLGRPVWANA